MSVIVASILTTTSCYKIEPPYFQNNGAIVTGDTVRKLLFEDFTGHDCVNCPSAHKKIEDLQAIYGDRIVVLAEHVGFFARVMAAPFDYDFKTATGDDYASVFGATAAPLPKGMVNREKINGNYLIDRDAFATAVSLVLDSMPIKPDIFIELSASFTSADSSISVDAKLTALSNMPAATYKLVVLVTESEIIQAQKNNDAIIGDIPEILDYNHKHVLRGSINSTWGDVFANSAISNGQTFTKNYTNSKIGHDWNPDNLHIVAFVYYADGSMQNVVIQAEEINLR